MFEIIRLLLVAPRSCSFVWVEWCLISLDAQTRIRQIWKHFLFYYQPLKSKKNLYNTHFFLVYWVLWAKNSYVHLEICYWQSCSTFITQVFEGLILKPKYFQLKVGVSLFLVQQFYNPYKMFIFHWKETEWWCP